MSHGPQPKRYSPLGQLIIARIKDFIRQPEAIFWSYAFPVLIVLALGVAFRNKAVTRTAVDIVGDDAARVQALLAADSRIQTKVSDEEQARMRLRTARAELVVVTDRNVSSSATPTSDQTPPVYQFLFDPTRPESELAHLQVEDALQRAAGRKDAISIADQLVQEPGSRYIDFLVPGLLGMNIMGGGLWGVGFAIVYMRIRKLLKRLVATPMKRSHFLTSVIFSRLLFMIPAVLIILLFSWLVFGVVIQGRIIDVVIFILAGAFTFSGIGLLVASRADTIETVSGLMNLVMLPMWVFSGVFFSSDRFPEMVQPIIKALPLTPLIDGLRASMLEGQALTSADQAVRLAWLVGWGAVTFGLALRWFRWK